MLLLVEVSDSSLTFECSVKLPLYARAGIAEYWIVDLKRRVIDVYRKPAGDGFGEMSTHFAGESIALALAPDIVVKLDLVFAERAWRAVGCAAVQPTSAAPLRNLAK